MKKKRTKQKKPRRPLSNWEMVFCVGSLVLMICIGIFYGYRSLYYFSKENYKMSAEAATLYGRVINDNKLVKNGDGLHQDTDGHYFKGTEVNNYVRYSNRLFRIIRVNKDNSVRVISDDIGASFMWGMETKYEGSNVSEWLDKNENKHSGVYYDTLGGVDKLTKKTEYTIDKLDNNKVVPGEEKYKSTITTLGIKDYTLAGGKNSYLNIGKVYWLLGYQNDMNLYISEEGSIEETTPTEGYGVRAVLTFKKDVSITGGTGTKDDPYVVDQKGNTTGVDSYVKLGNDLWKISLDDSTGYYTLYSVDYLKVGDVVPGTYDVRGSTLFDSNNRYNVAHYLNGTYLDSLTYRDYILLTPWKVGEISLDNDYNYYKIYDETHMSYVGLLNIFDYYSEDLDQFCYLNNTGSVSDMVYLHNKVGYLEEDSTKEARYMVPAISIRKDAIKGGTGTKDDPFTI